MGTKKKRDREEALRDIDIEIAGLIDEAARVERQPDSGKKSSRDVHASLLQRVEVLKAERERLRKAKTVVGSVKSPKRLGFAPVEEPAGGKRRRKVRVMKERRDVNTH